MARTYKDDRKHFERSNNFEGFFEHLKKGAKRKQKRMTFDY